jgi:Zn-dependent protease
MSDDLYRPDYPPLPRPPACDFDEEAIAPEDAAVLAELAVLQNQRPSWWGALILLTISLFLYMGVAQTQQAWDGVLLLVGALAFHELGHFVAMRFFGYRNLRMFFVPFFGAAVTGRHYNVEGWKKAIVGLMGPLPGIWLAAPAGFVGLALDQQWLVHVAWILLILNAFNLLPFLPLDGGWVLHSILFVRHPLLDVTFRLLASIGILGIAYLIGSWMLGIVGGFMLLSLPLTWRLARIAYNLRQRGVVTLSLEADTIPEETALPILAELRRVMPQQTTPRVLAQNLITVFETLNAHPPGVLASIGLFALYAGSFVMALVLTVVFIALGRPVA